MPRINDVLPRLYFPLLLVLCWAYSWRPLSGGDDVWAHAAIGRWIAQHGAVPHDTLFLWSATPIPWVYHSWLSQWVFYELLVRGEWWGPLCVLLLTCALVVVTFAFWWQRILHTLQTKQAPLWLPAVFALAIYCSSLRFHPRPEIFTACCLTLLLLWLTSEKSSPRTVAWPALGGVLLFTLWANFHGAVAIGLALVWIAALCDVVQDKWNGRALSSRAQRSVVLAVVSTTAIWLTPYGKEYVHALRPVGGAMFARIDEWKPFWRDPVLDPTYVAGEAVLVLIAFFAWLGNARRRWAELAWLLLMSAMFVSARRHLWLLPIVSLSVIASNARALSTLSLWSVMSNEGRGEILRRVARASVIGALVVAIALAAPPPTRWRHVVDESLPKAAASVVQKRFARFRIYNDYENSSYLQWRFGGKPLLFIDLLNAYPDHLIFDYLDIVSATPRGKTLLDQKRIQVVVLRKYDSHSPLAKLAAHLDGKSTQWRRAYSGDDGTIWARRDMNSVWPRPDF